MILYLKAQQYDEYEGIWGIPYMQYIICLFYNEDIFNANNIEPPKNVG